MPVKLPNSRPAGPHDLNPFESPATLLGMIQVEELCGLFRGVDWTIRRFSSGKWVADFVMHNGSTSTSGEFTLAEAMYTVYVTGIRLGKDE